MIGFWIHFEQVTDWLDVDVGEKEKNQRELHGYGKKDVTNY